jgi:hypothetical protein
MNAEDEIFRHFRHVTASGRLLFVGQIEEALDEGGVEFEGERATGLAIGDDGLHRFAGACGDAEIELAGTRAGGGLQSVGDATPLDFVGRLVNHFNGKAAAGEFQFAEGVFTHAIAGHGEDAGGSVDIGDGLQLLIDGILAEGGCGQCENQGPMSRHLTEHTNMFRRPATYDAVDRATVKTEW